MEINDILSSDRPPAIIIYGFISSVGLEATVISTMQADHGQNSGYLMEFIPLANPDRSAIPKCRVLSAKRDKIRYKNLGRDPVYYP